LGQSEINADLSGENATLSGGLSIREINLDVTAVTNRFEMEMNVGINSTVSVIGNVHDGSLPDAGSYLVKGHIFSLSISDDVKIFESAGRCDSVFITGDSGTCEMMNGGEIKGPDFSPCVEENGECVTCIFTEPVCNTLDSCVYSGTSCNGAANNPSSFLLRRLPVEPLAQLAALSS
jgi:hypothetical protein